MKKITAGILIIIFLFTISSNIFAFKDEIIKAAADSVGNYLYETVKEPQIGSIGGEWVILGLARSGFDIPKDYFERYYDSVLKYVEECNGVLHKRKYTEYSRVILALTSIGKNPSDVAGYNLLTPLGDYEKTVMQGINGAIWALIALDSGNYKIPENPSAKTQATRELYINYLLEKQRQDGGWTLNGEKADADITGMTLQALSRYQDNEKVKAATEKALMCLSSMQNESGGFSSYGKENSESCVQVLVALCELGIPVTDNRFMKNGNTVLDSILSFYDGEKGFRHIKDGEINQMATEQCFYALIALKRITEGESSLYDMTDSQWGLAGRNSDVRKMRKSLDDITFLDIEGYKFANSIEELAKRGIVSGKSENLFEPENTMTRGEFAAIIVKGLGLPLKNQGIFEDVKADQWFYPYINSAYSYGIIKGVSEKEFNPGGTITLEEAAVMVIRAAMLCGMDETASKEVLDKIKDGDEISPWALDSVALCIKKRILVIDSEKINPREKVKRGEIADMLYNMLLNCRLL